MRIRFLILTLAGLLMVAMSPSAHAQTPDSNPIGACLRSEVWLIVVDAEGTVLANQCVGTPANGEEALAAGGMSISRNRSGLICTIDNHPERCPSNFTGQFWNYHHAQPGSDWKFSDIGAAKRTPAPGSIEGWCYNAEDTQRCTPPRLKVVQEGRTVLPSGVQEEDLVELPVTAHEPVPLPSSSGSWIMLGVIGGGLALLAGGGYLVSRRRGGADGALGGR